MSAFTDTADSRVTSIEIMEAIEKVAIDAADAERVWDEPTSGELVAIQEIVTKNGMLDATDFVWGASRDQWAAQ